MRCGSAAALWLLALLWPGLGHSAAPPPVSCTTAPDWSYSLIDSQPHDPDSFTQGLLFIGETLAESSGRYAQSRLMLHHPGHSETLSLPAELFAEGLAYFDDKLWQLSWRAGRLRVYALNPLRLVDEQRYRGEGWGLTHSGEHFIMSDGSAYLQRRDSGDFSRLGSLLVQDGPRHVRRLNELEWVNGRILANVWQRDDIAVIAPDSGCVEAWLRLHELWPRMIRPRSADVMNGIAWKADSQELWITGKLWPRIYRLRVPALAAAPTPSQSAPPSNVK